VCVPRQPGRALLAAAVTLRLRYAGRKPPAAPAGQSGEIQMAKSDDHSTGDDREPYSDIGGSEGKHAQTHDVRREEATNSAPKVDEPDEFANDLANDNR